MSSSFPALQTFPAAFLCFGLGLAPALSADLPRRQVPPPLPLPPAFTWTGFYAGLNAGYGFRSGSKSFTDPTYGTVTQSGERGGFVGGG